MTEDHVHGPDGHVVAEVHSEPEVEAVAAGEMASAEVEIARIEADAAIQLARIEAKTEEAHDETEVEALRAEIRGMRDMLDRLVPQPEPESEPEPAPAPVVMEAPEAEPEAAPPVAEPAGEPRHSPKSRGLGFW